MDNSTEVTREEVSRLTTTIVAGLQSDPETSVCEKISDLTGHQSDNNKVYLKLKGGEVFRFAVSPIRQRKVGDSS